jgi:hypothetical protein
MNARFFRVPSLVVLTFIAFLAIALPAKAATLTVDLGNSKGVTLVGAFQRWDADGNPRRPVNPKAKIDAPEVDAKAVAAGRGKWVFKNLPPGRYDLVILAAGKIRVEGFDYPPVLEFDPFFAPSAPAPEEETRDWITNDIDKSRHYENKKASLYLAGDKKQVRVLMQLLRDQATSYDADFGAPAATMRHEVWQYTYNYGGWVKEKSTKVLDRILMARDELRRWTWVWEPKLGGIEMTDKPLAVSYELPARFDPKTARGLLPY